MPNYKFLGSTVWPGWKSDINIQTYILANLRTPTDFTQTYGLRFVSNLDCGDWKKKLPLVPLEVYPICVEYVERKLE